MKTEIKAILEAVQTGELSADEALLRLKQAPYEDLGFAKVDLHRRITQGIPEVIYGESKTPEQIVKILQTLRDSGQDNILITRLSEEAAAQIAAETELHYYPEGRIGMTGEKKAPDGIGRIAVVTAGTSDIPVAEEAAITAECFGNEVVRIYDVGVAGLHRLLSHMEEVMSASVIIAIAGMEGALASVVGGLADCPVIAVPTSVGYGASFDGLSALLAMMNSCASGVSVVNIDNGFGAGYLAGRINHMEAKS